jgi:predicted transcriptional regulator
MKKHSFDQFPVKNDKGEIIGMITSSILMTKLIKNKVTMNDPIKKVILKEFRNVSSSIPLHELGRVLARHSFVFVDNKYIASNFDLLNFIKEKSA